MLLLPSPAKINLSLRILERRQDNYHNIQSIIQFLDYYDLMRFSVRKDFKIILHTNLNNIPRDRNLIVRAAEKIQKESGCKLGVDIWIRKILPVGGGLGGGSSNAATTLLGLNLLWGLGLNLDSLRKIGITLGADIPIFIYGHASFVEGIGEILSPIILKEYWYLILSPNISIVTKEIFSHPLLTRNSRAITLEESKYLPGFNDFEELVKKLHPEVRKILELLGKYTRAQLSGTGSCVFGCFSNRKDGLSAFKKIKKKYENTEGFIARSSSTSILHRRINFLRRTTPILKYL